MTSIEIAGSDALGYRARLTLPVLVVAYGLVAALVSPAIYFDMLADYAQQFAVLPPLVLLGLAAVALVRHRHAPHAYLRRVATSRALPLAVTAGLVCVGLAAFTTFKILIPHVVPFWADPLFAGIDRALHGTDPGLIVHALLPDWAGHAIGVLYGPVWFLAWFGTMAAMALHPDAVLRQRYFWAMGLTVLLLGTVLATLLASFGPIFFDDLAGSSRFDALLLQIAESPVGAYMAEASGYLLASYGAERPSLGTGISAMPSMHLAIGTLHALLLGRLNRWAGLLGWGYVALLLVGSVYLGWHYAIDGYVSIAAVSLIWWVTGRRLERRPAGMSAAY
ncbi:MAG: phosphatase PAP2 family protein [Devosia sp.]|nr:phosphatase PAP2 family protein [Devosia sp.]